jgi:hypothetical protein
MSEEMLMCLDPVTMQPAQLIFSHWELIDKHCSVYQSMIEVSHQGADVPTINELNAQLDDIDEQLKTSELFLKLAGFDQMEIYN